EYGADNLKRYPPATNQRLPAVLQDALQPIQDNLVDLDVGGVARHRDLPVLGLQGDQSATERLEETKLDLAALLLTEGARGVCGFENKADENLRCSRSDGRIHG